MKQHMISIFLTLLFLSAGCSYNCEARKHMDQARNGISSNDQHKLSPDLSRAYKNEDHRKNVSVLVRTTAPLTAEQRKELNGHGIRIGTVSGNVFTADMQLNAIPFLVGRPYISAVELSKKLRLLQ